MTGVEILAMEEVAVAFAFNWSTFWLALGIIVGIGVFVGVICAWADQDWINMSIGIIVGVVFGSLIAIAFGYDNSLPTAYETQYKVTVSDEVPMNEFLERYEIIDQEGKIYTVRERDGE